ncbi:GGDEF domain-containing protein [uncultured Rhodoferax sp.]|uniref:GGDEF domain-containing protein n=1 Tax=uncultured Rhodoferax sp. TaxID=223188 RepID=UPI0025D0477C|nr:GGDEF domain-containing protein [uncultured Rhodoferax sp.]
MKSLLHHFRWEAWALLAAAACLALSPYLALLPLALALVRLGLRLRKALRQQAALQREIATLERNTQQLKSQAFTDNLTGLANRLLLADRFQLTLERSKRKKVPFALLMVDLNGFKAINDTYGHAAGDMVLRAVALRLLSTVRASDTVARIGGDEFVLLIESFEDPDELVHIGRKLIAAVSEPIELPGSGRVSVGASVGFGLFPRHGTDLDELLDIADRGMYDCKASGLMELH